MILFLRRIAFLSGTILLIYACNDVNNNVTFDASFKGGRLDSVLFLKNNSYRLLINPAFEPVNKSPYFAFSVTSGTPETINVVLDYGKYKHRYIPKLSTDKKNWKRIETKNISIDTITGNANLKLHVSSQKLFVAAQEIEASDDTYLWVDKMIAKHPKIKKTVTGKTVLKKDNYCLVFENDSVQPTLVLVARQHPPEIPGGTFSFKAFFEELFADTHIAKEFRSSFNIYTFPLLNPDGADLGNWRHNADGIDLNRDWVDFTQPETQMVKNVVEEKVSNGKKIQLAIDFHTSYSGPYLLILDSINEIKTKKIIPDWINNIESKSKFKVEARRRSQELPYCYNYFINAFGCEAVTYEEGDEVDRQLIKERAKAYALNLMKTMLTKLKNNEL